MKEIILNFPLKSGDQESSRLTMKKSTVGDEEDAQAMAVDLGRPFVALTAELCLFSILTGVPYDDLRSLSTVDYDLIRKAYNEVNRPAPLKKSPGSPDQGNPGSTPEYN